MKSKHKGIKIIIKILISLILIIMCVFIYESYINVNKESGNEGVIAEEKVEQKSITDIIEEVSHTIVGISKIKDIGSTIFLKDGANKLELGSGIVVSDDGYILTNEHVSGEKYSSCFVTLEGGKTYSGNVVWSDSDLDLAIVKIGIKGIEYAKLGNSEDCKVGSDVYAIGNPIGYEFQRTVTSGIISAVNRIIKIEENGKISYMSNLIQTDATINPGNSGGALINDKGEVIGINSVKITSAEGISFAIPINCVKKVIQKFNENGSFEEASIGIFAYDRDIISYIDNKTNYENGIYVEQISEDSSAKKSDLKEGDIITKIDGKDLDKMCDLREYIYEKKPDDAVTLEILRNNKKMTINLVLGRK